MGSFFSSARIHLLRSVGIVGNAVPEDRQHAAALDQQTVLLYSGFQWNEQLSSSPLFFVNTLKTIFSRLV